MVEEAGWGGRVHKKRLMFGNVVGMMMMMMKRALGPLPLIHWRLNQAPARSYGSV